MKDIKIKPLSTEDLETLNTFIGKETPITTIMKALNRNRGKQYQTPFLCALAHQYIYSINHNSIKLIRKREEPLLSEEDLVYYDLVQRVCEFLYVNKHTTPMSILQGIGMLSRPIKDDSTGGDYYSTTDINGEVKPVNTRQDIYVEYTMNDDGTIADTTVNGGRNCENAYYIKVKQNATRWIEKHLKRMERDSYITKEKAFNVVAVVNDKKDIVSFNESDETYRLYDTIYNRAKVNVRTDYEATHTGKKDIAETGKINNVFIGKALRAEAKKLSERYNLSVSAIIPCYDITATTKGRQYTQDNQPKHFDLVSKSLSNAMLFGQTGKAKTSMGMFRYHNAMRDECLNKYKRDFPNRIRSRIIEVEPTI